MTTSATTLRTSLVWGPALAFLVALAVMLGSERSEAAAFFQEDGTDVVYAQNCAPCHGAAGEGGVGPSLAGSTTPLADQLEIITLGRGGMPAFGVTLSQEQREAVAAFSVGLRRDVTEPPQVDLVGQGASVYQSACAFCHGEAGEGGAGPNLRTSSLSSPDLIALVREGRGSMPGFGDGISGDSLTALVAFMESLAGDQGTAAPDPALVAEGASLFTSYCSQCHGPDASGGLGPALKASTLSDAEMVSVISNGRGGMPGFSTILTADDVGAVVTYVDATRTAAGTEFTAAEPTVVGLETYVTSCATCHALDGSGGLGPSLANTSLSVNEVISQVFGGHPGDMPAFEGVLDATQVRDVAQYVLSLEGPASSQVPWAVYVVIAVGLVGVVVGLWYGGVLDLLWHRFRRRAEPEEPG